MSKGFFLRARRFWGDKRGLAALEFALLAPMMVLLMFGSIEIINLVQANRRVENTAASLADVISRDTNVTNAEITGIWTAMALLMDPDDAEDLSVRITSISVDSSGTARVVWNDRTGDFYPSLAANAVVNGLDSAMRQPSTSIIRVETNFTYRPRLGFFFMDDNRQVGSEMNNRTLGHTAYRRSRLVDPITRTS